MSNKSARIALDEGETDRMLWMGPINKLVGETNWLVVLALCRHMEKIRNAAADEEVCGLKRKARCKVAIDQQETERGLSLALWEPERTLFSHWGEQIRLIKEESLDENQRASGSTRQVVQKAQGVRIRESDKCGIASQHSSPSPQSWTDR